MSLTLDESTTAETPGGIRASIPKLLRYHIKFFGVIALLAFAVIAVPVLRKDSNRSLLPLVPLVIFSFVKIIRVREHLLEGDLVPAVVLDSDRGLIAVFTDLTAVADHRRPVIRIVREQLDLIRTRNIHDGVRLPAVAIYSRGRDRNVPTSWADFLPRVADCFTDDLNACDHARSRISAEAWDFLDMGLKQLRKPLVPGLHEIQLPSEEYP